MLSPSECLKPEHENIYEIDLLIQQLPSNKSLHVKGHQQGPNLDWQAVLNNRVDYLADIARHDTEHPEFAIPPNARATVISNNIEVPSHIET